MNQLIFRCSRRALVILALVGALAFIPVGAFAADHLDGPRLMANPTTLGNLDINDVYIFRAFNPKNTVLIMTLSPAAGVLGPAMFNPLGTYQFEIENTNDTNPDLTIQFTFGTPASNGRQPYQFVAMDAAGTVHLAGKGVSGKNTTVRGGAMVRPDLYDDPFFFDLNAFNKFKAAALAGNPAAGSVFLNRNVGNIPQNFFGGFNVMAIVLEVPSVLLQASKKNTQIAVWARTLLPGGVQFDRMARPAINTVLLPDDQKDAFNSSVPAQDMGFIPAATLELTKLFGNPTSALAHAQLLLPDLMTFDTSSNKGFLNGRRLIDDVIDAELSLLTGGVVSSDGVVNDSVFSAKFPYLGSPNPKQVTLRAMQVAAEGVNGGGGVSPGSPRYSFQGTKSRLSGTDSKTGKPASAGDGAPTNSGTGASAKAGGSNVLAGQSAGGGYGAGSYTGSPAMGQPSSNAQAETVSNPGASPTGLTVAQPKTAKPKSKTGKPKPKTVEEKPKPAEAKSSEPMPKS